MMATAETEPSNVAGPVCETGGTDNLTMAEHICRFPRFRRFVFQTFRRFSVLGSVLGSRFPVLVPVLCVVRCGWRLLRFLRLPVALPPGHDTCTQDCRIEPEPRTRNPEPGTEPGTFGTRNLRKQNRWNDWNLRNLWNLWYRECYDRGDRSTS
jgi:hypothetical protein